MPHDKYIETGLEEYRKQAIKASKGLLYDISVIRALEKAKSVGEVEHIMVTARNRSFND